MVSTKVTRFVTRWVESTFYEELRYFEGYIFLIQFEDAIAKRLHQGIEKKGAGSDISISSQVTVKFKSKKRPCPRKRMPIVFKLMPISISCTHCTVVKRCIVKGNARHCNGEGKSTFDKPQVEQTPSFPVWNELMRALHLLLIYDESVTSQTFDSTG